MERQGRAKMAKLEPRWPKRAPRWSQDGQLGAKMEPILAKLEPRWPKRAPRWSQDGQVGAKMEPTWLQDAKDASTWADIVPILKKLPFPLFFLDFRSPKGASGCPRESQGRAKTAKLEPRWLQDGPRDRQDGQVGAKREPTWLQDGPRCAKMEPRERQDGAKMAKSEPKWSQHGSKMLKMRQHGPTLCLS